MSNYLHESCFKKHRNTVASAVAGIFFFTGWWIIIDVGEIYKQEFNGVNHLSGIFGTVGFFMVNTVSTSAVRGEYSYGSKRCCSSKMAARMWLFVGCLICFLSVISSLNVLIGFDGTTQPLYMGVGLLLQNVFIFLATFIFKFGRIYEEPW